MYIKVKAFPKAKKEEIKEITENRFEIKVKEKAEKNLANKRIIEMLAQYFGIEEKDVKIISGHHHPSKLIGINFNKNHI